MTDRRRFLSTLLAGAGLAALPGGQLAWASIEQEAADFLNNLGQRAIAELTDESVDRQVRVDRFRALMVEGVDFNLIAQQVLGRHWRNNGEDERQEFAVVLRETLINRFLPLFDKYEGESFKVVSTRTSSQDASLVAATTNVIAPSGDIARVEWYMKRFGQGLRIYDFSAEGVRLTISLQDEYNSVLNQADGDLSVLVDQLKAKLPSTARLTS
jgi:phospholipid transport system substrate-binding protein